MEGWHRVALPDCGVEGNCAAGAVQMVLVGTNSGLINDLFMAFNATKRAADVVCNVRRMVWTDSTDMSCDVLRCRFEAIWRQAQRGDAADADCGRRIIVY